MDGPGTEYTTVSVKATDDAGMGTVSVQGTGGAGMATDAEVTTICRAAIAAIAAGDARSLLAAVKSHQLPMQTAANILRQAWRADKRNNKVGAVLATDGLLSAVFIGVSEAQGEESVQQHGDNAGMLVASVARIDDDAQLLGVLLNWEPGWRVCPTHLMEHMAGGITDLPKKGG